VGPILCLQCDIGGRGGECHEYCVICLCELYGFVEGMLPRRECKVYMPVI